MTEIDPKLSRLYREASSEDPPAALDAAILAAARKEVAKPHGRASSQCHGRSLWSRWMVPISAIATLVLGVSIAFLVEREHPETIDDTAIRQIPPRPQSWPPAPVTESAKSKAAEKEAPAAAEPAPPAPAQAPVPAVPTQVPESGVPAQAPVSVVPAQAPVSAEPAPSAAEPFPAESRAKTSAPGVAAPEAAAPNAATESNVAGDSAIGGAGVAAPAAPAAAGKLAPMRQQAIHRSPEAWLEEISRLKREGREKEAAEQLAEFRKAYPAYAVPESILR